MMYFFNGNNSSFLLEDWDVNLSLDLFCKITVLKRGCSASFIFFFLPLSICVFSQSAYPDENCMTLERLERGGVE